MYSINSIICKKMARKRLEEALVVGNNIAANSLSIASLSNPVSDSPSFDFISEFRTKRASLRVHMPLDRHGIYCLKYSPDGNNLAIGFGNGGVSVLKCSDHKRLATELMHGNRKSLATMSVQYNKNGSLLFSAGACGEVNVWKMSATNAPEAAFALSEDGNEINALDLCSDSTFFATTGKDRHIRLYDTNTLRLYHTIVAPDPITMDEVSVLTGHTKRVFALKFHPEENHLFVTAGWDDCMKVWDKRMSRAARKSISGPHVCGAGVDLRGNQILTGSWTAKNSLQLWDLRGGSLDRHIPYPCDRSGGEFLYCVQFLSDCEIVAGGSGSNTVCVFDLNTNSLVDIIKSDKSVLTADSHSEGKVLASAGIGGNLHISTTD